MASPPPSQFEIKLTYKGKSATIAVTTSTSVLDLNSAARREFPDLADPTATTLKLLHRGKVLFDANGSSSPDAPAFPAGVKSKSAARVVIMATPTEQLTEIATRRSDPTVRGFQNEAKPPPSRKLHWGPQTSQHRHYKFVRLQECTDASFGTRPVTSTPHAYRAAELLERLATDPGVVSIMVERELVVNTLGEMDPIDDRLMQKKKTEEGRCLLGYNTNRGLRIDVKLRPDTLDGFLPYEDVAATLIHELSHNWVGEHNALFWANYGQMRVEYLHTHARLAAEGHVVNGRTTASMAGVAELCAGGLSGIEEVVVKEVKGEMRQHGVPIEMVAPAIRKRCEEIEAEGKGLEGGRKLGGGSAASPSAGGNAGNVSGGTPRELALAAAERRAREGREKDEKKGENDSNR